MRCTTSTGHTLMAVGPGAVHVAFRGQEHPENIDLLSLQELSGEAKHQPFVLLGVHKNMISAKYPPC